MNPRPWRHQSRWEIVRTPAGWHARFIARNGRKVMTSEVYTTRAAAYRATRVVTYESGSSMIRDVDERALHGLDEPGEL